MIMRKSNLISKKFPEKKNKHFKPLDKRKYGKVESLCTFKCNCRCIMCSVANSIKNGKDAKPFEDVKKDIDIAVKAKAHTFAFSGGEPTLRKDLFQLVKYAKKKISNIEIQSNGRMYYYKDYCQKLIKAGVNIFVVSFYSPFENIHDQIMGAKGAYAQTLQGLKNLKELGQTVKINIVILKLNYLHLPELVKFLLNLEIEEFRFIYVTLEGNALKNPNAVVAKMSTVTPYLQKALKIGLKKVPCYVYNMVPCVLPGYEGIINDIFQSDTYLRGPDFECSIDENRRKMKVKSKMCGKCKYNEYCYGIWENYADFFGFEELKPVK
jgi:MoaA/NifB/PqqE/SkfB family radical SAM enzyme